jgi:hypothetical protein
MRRMTADGLTVTLLAAAALELGAAGFYFHAAFDRARPALPAPLRASQTPRLGVDRFIWNGQVPAAARRSYLLAHACASLGLLCLAILALANGPPAGALLFTASSALALADTLACWRKYRGAGNAGPI